MPTTFAKPPHPRYRPSCISWPSLVHMDLITSKLSCFLSLFFVFLFFNCAKADINGDANALLGFKGNVTNTRNLASWSSSSIASICTSWDGVICSAGNGSSQRVIELRLPGSTLYGAIPPQTLGNLDALEVLSLRKNNLSGNLPADLANCVNLTQLNLQKNSFSGPLPASFSVWPLMQRIDLSSNNFSGEIPASLSNLTHLKLLFLENNKLSGSIPPLTIASSGNFSVASNNLSGPIPSSLSRFPAESFAGNTGLCGAPLGECDQSSSGSRLSAGAIAGIVIGAVAAIAAVCFVALGWRRRKSQRQGGAAAGRRREFEEEEPANNNTGSGSHGNRLTFVGSNSKETFDLEDLLRATAEVLGKGSLGPAYKAIMDNGLALRVKRVLSAVASEREDDSKRVLQQLGSLHHPSLVPLRAFFLAPKDTLLVSDYMPNGDLSSLLHHGIGRDVMDWETRLGIAGAVARGLLYLHSEKVVHGDIKSSNVVLDRDGQARLNDYGVVRLVAFQPQPGSNLKSNGYTPPEAGSRLRKISCEGDVYAFGVLLLELLTRKSPIALAQQGISLPQWIQQAHDRPEQALDSHIMKPHYVQERMIRLLHIALPCVALSPDQRPSMAKLVQMIDSLTNQEDLELFYDPFPNNAEISSPPTSLL